MNRFKKVILSLSIAFSMAIALVIGVVNMPKNSTNTPNTVNANVDKGYDIIKSESTLKYIYDPTQQSTDNLTKVYEYTFSNTMLSEMAVILKELSHDNITFTYASSLTEVINTSALTFSAMPKVVAIPANKSVYIYIKATVDNSTIPFTYSSPITWTYGYAQYITCYANGEALGEPILGICNAGITTPETLQTPTMPDGYEFGGWYLDEACTQPLTSLGGAINTQLYAKIEEPYPEATLTHSSWFQLNDEGTGYTVVRGNSSELPSDGNVVIPQTYGPNNLPVTAIAEGEFDEFDGGYPIFSSMLTSITLPSTMEYIGDYAFSNATILETFDMSQCSNLTLGTMVFCYCSIVKDWILPNEWTTIPFACADGLTANSVVIPSGITSIDSWAFANSNIVTIDLSHCKDLITIGDSAFGSNFGLTSITIPSSVTSIGDNAFSYCFSLSSVQIEGNSQLTSIGNNAFRSCSGLTSITIPSSVTKIGNRAFEGCTGLTATGSAGIIFEGTGTWYRTSSSAYTGGIQTSVTSPTQNATWFVSTSGYYDYYWYKK